MLSPSDTDRIRSLLPAARLARRQHSLESPQGRASAELSLLLARAYTGSEATPRELADLTGLSYHSVARRIRVATGTTVRQAAPPTPPKTPDEKPPSPENAPENPENPPGPSPSALTGVVLPPHLRAAPPAPLEIPEALTS